MKKFWVVLGVVVMAVQLMAFKDVPRSHWAYKAVIALSKLGILTGYPDNTFRGENTVSRYQLAYALYKMVIYVQEYVENEVSNTDYLASLKRELSRISDMSAKAYKWAMENSDEISRLKLRMDEMEKKIESGSGEGISNVFEEIASLKSEFDQKLQGISVRLDGKYSNLEKRVKTLEDKISSFDFSQIVDFKKAIEDVKGVSLDVEVLRRDLVSVESSLVNLSASMTSLKEAFSSLREEVSEEVKEYSTSITSSVTALAEALGSTQASVTTLGSDVRVLKETTSNLEKMLKDDIGELRRDVDELYKKRSSTQLYIFSYLFSLVLFGVAVYIAIAY